MKTPRVIVGFVTALLVVSCATFDINYDYDPEFDFAVLKTYDWMSIPKKHRANELTIKHIKSAVNRELRARGLTMTSENPDVLIALHGGKEKKVDVQEWGYAYGHGGYYGGGPYWRGAYGRPYGPETYHYRRGIDTYEYEVGTLIIDFVEAKKKELLWRGSAFGVVDPHITIEEINEIIGKILANYPPSKKE